MYTFNDSNLGEFQLRSTGVWFTYRETTNPWALENGLRHEYDVLDGIRFANVKKTVVHACIDEDEDAKAVIETRQLKSNVVYKRA
ncbi:hypothetical protein UFOVP1355_45 [uncultured Caudovirales phage]|uniref:Uncharacterized protein n=1 Tax=uncultured Caudovirales phage TaxID=2100421 RepID=A0A6J5RSR2_9CAUD|nr:hypothetical protein UFOVP1355_45 [uncultured Caudovirales phage]